MNSYGISRPILFLALLILLPGLLVTDPFGSARAKGPGAPPGALQRLIVEHDSRVYHFGPFVGYYFVPNQDQDLTSLDLWCYNERQFYTRDLPDGALLFKGQARFACLPEPAPYQPGPDRRMRPVFAADIPQAWKETRPEHEGFLHFHSGFDASGAAACGYWLRHEALAEFTYDLGGRVGPKSPLYHKVHPGLDLDFAVIVEFDAGPK